MVRKGMFVAVMVMAAALGSASAYAGGWAIGVNGGVLKGVGDFGDATNTGFGGGAFVDYVVNSMFSVGVDGSFYSDKLKIDGEDASTVIDPAASGTVDAKVTIIPVALHAKYWFPMGENPFKAYLTAGAGMYSVKTKIEYTDFSGESTDSKFGGRGGLGIDYMVNPTFGIGAEGNYHFISTEGSSTSMITGVVQLTYHMPMSAAK